MIKVESMPTSNPSGDQPLVIIQEIPTDKTETHPFATEASIGRSPSKRRKRNPVRESKINWADYDSPCCFKLIHFNIKEVHPRIRPIFTSLYYNFFILLVLQTFKIIAHIFLIDKNDIVLIIVIILYPLSIIIKHISIYAAYRGLFYDGSFKLWYKGLSFSLIVYAAINAGWKYPFDGIIVILEYKKRPETSDFTMFILICEYVFNGIFLIVETLALIFYIVVEILYDRGG